MGWGGLAGVLVGWRVGWLACWLARADFCIESGFFEPCCKLNYPLDCAKQFWYGVLRLVPVHFSRCLFALLAEEEVFWCFPSVAATVDLSVFVVKALMVVCKVTVASPGCI
jgi:hypothetical protein